LEANNIISSGILEMYALGQTTAAESAQVEAWLQQYPELRDELQAIELGMEQYAMMNAVKPSEKVKTNILTAIRNSEAAPTTAAAPVKKLVPSYWKMVAAASVVLLIGSAAANWYYYNKFKQTDTALQQNRSELMAANQKMDSIYSDMEVVTNKFSRTVALDGMDPAPEAAAKVFWMKNTGEVFIDASNLPQTPQGMQYQLWAFVDGKPVDAGMIITTPNNKYNIQKMKTFGRAEAFAVTLETEGGHPTPKGKVYVMGKL
jgi:anti-sigma-K factor RskA